MSGGAGGRDVVRQRGRYGVLWGVACQTRTWHEG